MTGSDSAMSTVSFSSWFYGYQALVNRDTTYDGSPAYDYAVNLIKTGEDTGQRLRSFHLGRWRHYLSTGG